MKKITLKELENIRDQYKKSLNVRKGEAKNKIVVHMGTCGIASGARDVMNAILEELGREDAPEVTVTQSSCIGLCDREPIVTVMRMQEAPVRYYRMDAEKVRRVFREHIVNGQIVEQFTQ